MGLIPNNQTFIAGASGTIVTDKSTVFRRRMDSVLLGGWNITIDLPPGQSDCPSPRCRYNPTYERYQDINGGPCRDCKGQGSIVEPRYTIYKCNRRWTNEPLDQSENTGEKTVAGRVFGNYVRVKTVGAAWEHIQNSIGATIDGVKVKLYREPRRTGWGGTNLYIISWWERANKTDG
jgi:hypothetical protein